MRFFRSLRAIFYCFSSCLIISCGGDSKDKDINDTSSSNLSVTSSSSITSTSTTSTSSTNQDTLSGVRNVPTENKILFIMGQDSDTLDDYKREVLDNPAHANMPAPGGVTLYTSILPTTLHTNSAPSDADLYISGIEGPPANQANGNVDFASTLAAYDHANSNKKVALAVGLYLSDEWNDCSNQPLRAITNNGDSDIGDASDTGSVAHQWRYAVDRMLLWFKQEERPVYLRIGYEFDGPWNCYNQDFYKQAFRYIKQRIDVLGAKNVATVWQAATYPDDGSVQDNYAPSTDAMEYYEAWFPGADVVDWVGISFFAGSEYLSYQWSCQDNSKPWTVPDISPRALQNTLISHAKKYNKPVIIAESAPQGTNSTSLDWSCVAARQDHLADHRFEDGEELWNSFFADYFSWITNNKDAIRAVAYINTNWQSQERWYCDPEADACPVGYWGDTRIQANATILRHFKTELSKPIYQVNGRFSIDKDAPDNFHSSVPQHANSSSMASSSISEAASVSSSNQNTSIPSASTSSNNDTSSTDSQTPLVNCPTSHPFFSQVCTQCFADQQQAESVCPSNNSSNSPPAIMSSSSIDASAEGLASKDAFTQSAKTRLVDGVLVSHRAERYRVRHEISTENFNNYNVEYWEGRFGWFEVQDYSLPEAQTKRVAACGTPDPCVVVTLHGAIQTAMVDDQNQEKDCNQQVPNWRYHKVFGSETDFRIGYVMDLVMQDGSTVPACQATRNQRAASTIWRATMKPDQNVDREFKAGEQIEFETTISFNRARLSGDNVNYYGQTFRYVLGEGFVTNNRDAVVGPLNIAEQLGGDTSIPQLAEEGGDQQRFAFMQHAYNLGPDNVQTFLNGRRLFHTNFTTGDHIEEFMPGPQAVNGNLPFPEQAGLTTDPIQSSCTECHTLNGVGSLQEKQEVVPPKLIGLGLLEAIPDETIEQWAQESGGKISKVNFQGKEYIGRFGWKAETISVKHQVAKALFLDMGVGTSFSAEFGPEELTDDKVDALTAYSKLLAVPAPRQNLKTLTGHEVFQDFSCNKCHKLITQTGENEFSELSYQTIRPYTDLLLHDLGEGEYRTAPLWGLGLSDYIKEGVRGEFQLMHDGKSLSIEDAISRHDGDASESRKAYENATPDAQQALLEYLMAL